MKNLKEYSINDEIFDNSDFFLYKAINKIKKIPVILKALNAKNINDNNINDLIYEFEILNNYKLNCFLNISDYNLKNDHFIAFNDNNYILFNEYLNKNKQSKESFIHTAINLAKAVKNIHDNDIVFNRINPFNIIFDPKTNETKFINLSNSSQFSYQKFKIQIFNKYELNYTSPEQIFKNNIIDYRTDFFSLGLTYYKMITGKRFFNAGSYHDYINFILYNEDHIKKTLKDNISHELIKILLKLINNDPDNRYQYADELLFDLNKILNKSKTIKTGQFNNKTAYKKFVFSNKLYNLDKILNEIIQLYDYSVSKNNFTLLKGPDGTGKSSLIKQANNYFIKNNIFCLTFKFELSKIEIPLYSFSAGFENFINNIINDSKENIEILKKILINSIGPEIQNLTEIIPNLNLLFNEPETNLELSIEEKKNKFELLFQNFIICLMSINKPSAIILEDIEYADDTSIMLIKMLLNNYKFVKTLVICTISDNLNYQYIYDFLIKDINKNNYMFNIIKTKNLSLLEQKEFISRNLININNKINNKINQITNGNPFLIKFLLNYFFINKFLYFNNINNIFKFNLAKLQIFKIQNIKELLIKIFNDASIDFKKTLITAAFIGSCFEEKIIIKILQNKPSVIKKHLIEASKYGLIITDKEFYYFSHEIILNEILNLINNNEKISINNNISKYYLSNMDQIKSNENIWTTLNYLNKTIIENKKEKIIIQIIQLNITAAKKLRIVPSLFHIDIFLNFALSNFKNSYWEKYPEISFNLYYELMQNDYLKNDFSSFHNYFNLIIKKEKNIMNLSKIYSLKILALIKQNLYDKAFDTGLEILTILGLKINKKIKLTEIIISMILSKITLFLNSENKLINLKPMTNEFQINICDIVLKLGRISSITSPRHIPILIWHALKITLKYGTSDHASVLYEIFSIVYILECKMQKAFKLGQLSLKLSKNVKQYNILSIFKFLYYTCIHHWYNNLIDTTEYLKSLHLECFKTGSFEYTIHSIYNYHLNCLISGKSLIKLTKEIDYFNTTMSSAVSTESTESWKINFQIIILLTDDSKYTTDITGEYFNEKKMVNHFFEIQDYLNLVNYYILKMMLCLLFEDIDTAFVFSKDAKKYLIGILTGSQIVNYYYYESLILINKMKHSSNEDKIKFFKTINKNQKLLKKWSKTCKDNILHKYFLINAELYNLNNNYKKVENFFNKAIFEAKRVNFTNEIAYCLESFAKYYLKLNDINNAKKYFKNSYSYYLKWGASSKLTHLSQKYGEYLK